MWTSHQGANMAKEKFSIKELEEQFEQMKYSLNFYKDKYTENIERYNYIQGELKKETSKPRREQSSDVISTQKSQLSVLTSIMNRLKQEIAYLEKEIAKFEIKLTKQKDKQNSSEQQMQR